MGIQGVSLVIFIRYLLYLPIYYLILRRVRWELALRNALRYREGMQLKLHMWSHPLFSWYRCAILTLWSSKWEKEEGDRDVHKWHLSPSVGTVPLTTCGPTATGLPRSNK
jgi:hypothetical protein